MYACAPLPLAPAHFSFGLHVCRPPDTFPIDFFCSSVPSIHSSPAMHNALRCSLLSLFALTVLIAAPAQAQDPDELGDALSAIGQQYADNYSTPTTTPSP